MLSGTFGAPYPKPILVEVTPDIVGLTDVAEIVGCSRQNMRKLLITGGARGPAPIHEGASTLWHLAPVLELAGAR